MKLINFMRTISTRTYAVTAMAIAAVVVPAGLLAWGPDRATFTIAHPATYNTFNSITDNPNIGDERNFVGIRENNTNGLWQDNQTVQPGKEYVVRMYVHNNASANLGLVAQNVTASFNLPTTTAKSIQVQGFLRSSNANPPEVYDHANFTANENFNLAVVPGSIKYYNNANGNGFTIPESVFTNSGAKLGYDKMDGNIPGCFQYAGYLTFIVKPQFATPASDFTMQKRVKVAGSNDAWSENVTVAPGTKVTYRLDFANTGTSKLSNVTLKDTLPKNVSLVPGTVKIYNATSPNGAMVAGGDSLTTATGLNIGAYTGGGSNAVIMFDAMVAKEADLVCGVNKLHNIASATPEGQNPKEDGADVTVKKDCAPEKVKACNTKTGIIEDVEKGKENTAPYTTDLTKCQPTKVEACNLDTKKIETNVDSKKIDNIHYTTDMSKCAPKCPIPGKESLPKDSADCKETPTTPTELPKTGIANGLLSVLGAGSLIGTAAAYVASRKQS